MFHGLACWRPVPVAHGGLAFPFFPNSSQQECCQICDAMVPQSAIQSHYQRCLETQQDDFLASDRCAQCG